MRVARHCAAGVATSGTCVSASNAVAISETGNDASTPSFACEIIAQYLQAIKECIGKKLKRIVGEEERRI
jgi:hypothetical protein